MFTRSSVRLRRQDRRDEQLVRVRRGRARSARRDTRPGAAARLRRRALARRGVGPSAEGTLDACPLRSSPTVTPAEFAERRRHVRRASTTRSLASTGHAALGDAVWRDLAQPDPDSLGLLARRSRVRARRAQRQLLAPALGDRPRAHARPRARAEIVARAARRGRARTSPRTAAAAWSCWVFGATDDDDAARAPPASRPRAISTRCASRSRSPSTPMWPAGFEVRDFEPGRDEAAWLAREQPRVREPPRAGRLDRGDAAAPAWPSPGSTRRSSCSRSTPTGSPASTGASCTPRVGAEPALGEICVIGVDPRMAGHAASGAPLAIDGLRAVHERGVAHRLAVHRADNDARAQAVPAPRLRRAPHRPRLRTRGRRPRDAPATAPTRDDVPRRCSPRGASRRTAPTRSTTGCGRNGVRSRRSRTSAKELRARARGGAPARARRPSPSSTATTASPPSGSGARPTARRSRPSSCATTTARPCASRRRPAARWAARSARPVRPASSGTSTPARSSSRSLRAQHASPQRVGNVVFMGMGEPLANVDAGARVAHAPARRRRLLGPPPHGVDRRRRARHATASREFPLPVTLAVSLHAPDDALRERARPARTAATRSPRCSTPPARTRTPRAGGSRSSTRASRA